jgi:hypothetical protein
MLTSMLTPLLLSLFTLATAAPSPQVPDTPIDFVVSIFETSPTCVAPGKAVFGTGCQNRTLPAGGSALVRISTASPNGYVTGYAEANCKGEVVVVFASTDGCSGFDGKVVKSWVGKAPFDEGGK